MSEVLLALKRDATTDPPEYEGYVWTDQGAGAIHPDQGIWVDSYGRPLSPSWWLDISQGAEGEGLTVEDLETAHDAAQMLTGSDFHKRDWPRMYRCQDRLRAALDALGGTS